MGQLRIPRNLAVAVGVEPTPFLINSQAGYRLPDATLEPTVGIAPTSPRYEGGILLLNYVGLEGAAGADPADGWLAEQAADNRQTEVQFLPGAPRGRSVMVLHGWLWPTQTGFNSRRSLQSFRARSPESHHPFLLMREAFCC